MFSQYTPAPTRSPTRESSGAIDSIILAHRIRILSSLLPMLSPPARRRLLLLTLVAIAATAATGCVKRRMTVRSNPPGARVFVDNQEIGVTPVSTSFVYYAPRKIQLIKEGYETLSVMHRFDAPWYEYPPLDFFSENFSPSEIRDERVVDFQLIPQQLVPNEILLERAEQLRGQAMQGHAVPLFTPQVAPATIPAAPQPPTPFPAMPAAGMAPSGMAPPAFPP